MTRNSSRLIFPEHATVRLLRDQAKRLGRASEAESPTDAQFQVACLKALNPKRHCAPLGYADNGRLDRVAQRLDTEPQLIHRRFPELRQYGGRRLLLEGSTLLHVAANLATSKQPDFSSTAALTSTRELMSAAPERVARLPSSTPSHGLGIGASRWRNCCWSAGQTCRFARGCLATTSIPMSLWIAHPYGMPCGSRARKAKP